MFNTWMILVGISVSLSGVPQIIRLRQCKASEEVSLALWLILLHGQFWFTYYAYNNHDVPLFTTNVMSILINSVIIYYTLKYRNIKWAELRNCLTSYLKMK